jgi:hypothetical protein
MDREMEKKIGARWREITSITSTNFYAPEAWSAKTGFFEGANWMREEMMKEIEPYLHDAYALQAFLQAAPGISNKVRMKDPAMEHGGGND